MAIPKLNDKGRMSGIPLSPEAKITVERRGEIVLIGVNRPQISNRFDPDAFFGLARANYDLTTIRACGRPCSSATARTSPAASTWTPSRPWPNKPFAIKDGMLDPFARTQQLSKPLIAAVAE